MNPSDLTLLERWAAQRDAEAFGQLVKRHGDMVYTACLRILHNEADASEVTQDCFITLMKSRLPAKCASSSLGAWVHTIATRLALNRLRETRRRTMREARYGAQQPRSEHAPDVDDLPARVDEALAKLPEDLREPLILHFLEGLSHQAVAERLDIPRRTVTSRISRGIDEVRRLLKRRGIAITMSALASLLSADSSYAAPAAVTGTLGKLALAGSASASPSPVVAGGTTLLGGIAIVKGLSLLAVVVLILGAMLGSYLAFQHRSVIPVKALPESTRTDHAATASQSPKPPLTPKRFASAAVTGVVLDTSQHPVPGATVTLRWAGQRRDAALSAVSSADGSFTLKGPMAGSDLVLLAKKKDWVQAPPMRQKMGFGGLQDVHLTMYRAASIEGMVVDTRGWPVADMAVVSSDSGGLESSRADTDAGGQFTLDGFLPGTYRLTVLPKDSQFRRDLEDAHAELQEGQHLTGLQIVYGGDEPFVAGRVTNAAGEPMAGVLVQCLWKDLSPGAHTDFEGRYRITRLPVEGEVMVSASEQDYHPAMQTGQTGSEDVDIVLYGLDPGAVTGRVVDAVTRAPIQDFEIQARNDIYADLLWNQQSSFRKVHDEQGRFDLKNVASGGATIVARAEGYAPTVVPVRLDLGSPGDLVIPLTKGRAISGAVVTSEGVGVADAYVFVGDAPPLVWADPQRQKFLEDGTWKGDARAKTDAQGNFTLRGLTDEPQRITALQRTLGTGRVEVDPLEPETAGIRIVIGAGGEVTGRVTVGGQPAGNATVFARTMPDFQLWNVRASVGNDGTFSFSRVPAGDVEINVMVEGDVPLSKLRFVERRVFVRNDGATDVSFDFPAGGASIEGVVTAQGQPVKGSVNLFMEGPFGLESSCTQVSGTGKYFFTGIPAGTAVLKATVMLEPMERNGSAWVPHNTEKAITVYVPEHGSVVQDLEVFDSAATASISGYVDGLAPIERAQIYLLSGTVDLSGFQQHMLAELQPQMNGFTMPGADGHYLLTGLEPGQYTLLAIATTATFSGEFRNMRYAATTVTLEKDRNTAVAFDLRGT